MGGRQKGTPNKSKVARVGEFLAEKGVNPAQEILDIIPTLDARDQLSAWLDLLSYCQAKPKAVEETLPDEGDEELGEITNAQLLELVKQK